MIRHGDWKFIEEGASYYGWRDQPLQLYNIPEDPYENRNVAAEHPDLVRKLRARLAHHRQFARTGEQVERIPGYPPPVYGEREAAEHGAEIRKTLDELGLPEKDVTIRRR
ncbi:MAG: hypothetical protein GY953_46245 [bacterium]|nr:hypothetical protein [bacterium]